MKKLLICLNKTALSHTQLIDEDLLKSLSKKYRIYVISPYKLQLDNRIEKYLYKKHKFQEKQKSNFLSKFLYLLKSVKLNTTFKLKNNSTIYDFYKIHLNQLFLKRKYFSYLAFTLIHFFIRFKTILKVFNKFEAICIENKELSKKIDQISPNLVILTSPGWWSPDDIYLSSINKLNVKTLCMILSWDQPTGMGMVSNKCSKYLVWSDQVKKDLNIYHKINKDLIYVIGAIHWSHYFNIKKTKINDPIKNILICLKSPTRTRIADTIRMIKRIRILNIKYKFKIRIRPHPIYYSKRYIEDLEKLNSLEKKFGNIQISNIYGNKPIKRYLTNEKSLDLNFIINNEKYYRNVLYSHLNNSDLIINFFSTINIEASLMNIPIINFVDDEIYKVLASYSDKKNLRIDENQIHVKRIKKRISTCYNYKELEKKINIFLENKYHEASNRNKFAKEETNLIHNPIEKILNLI